MERTRSVRQSLRARTMSFLGRQVQEGDDLDTRRIKVSGRKGA